MLAQMDVRWLRQPIEAQIDALASELYEQWLAFKFTALTKRIIVLTQESNLNRKERLSADLKRYCI